MNISTMSEENNDDNIKIPTVKLNNGLEIPQFGLGTWKSQPGEVMDAVICAIDAGYRHIDCAFVYGNEVEVGRGIKAKIDDGTVTRQDLWITSKLWNTYHRPNLVEVGLKKSLENLGLEYLDLFLIHWPFAYKEDGENFPFDANGKIQFSGVDYVDTWKEMEECLNKCLTRSIGVSNFNKKQVERILSVAKVKPVMNQIECHPYLNQSRLIEFLKSKDIAVTGYSPLGSPDRPWAKPSDPQLMDDPKLKEVALKYKKTPAQILLRWAIDRGVITIPKSITVTRIHENIDIFDFSLSKEDIEYINTFDCNGRLCPLDAARDHIHHPFVRDEY